MNSRNLVFLLMAVAASGIVASQASGSDSLSWPDGRQVRIVQPNPQVDLSSLRSGVVGRVTDRRFNTNQAMYLANEMYLAGTEFFLRMSEQGLPIGNDPQLSFITNVEAYWYSRYNLVSVNARSRMGIGAIHGPYLDLLAREAQDLNRFGRARGELSVSNKDVMLTQVMASYLARTGMPEKFENAVPVMLEFQSGDPHFTTSVDLEVQSNGRARYIDDFETLRWSHDRMDKTIDMAGVGQTMLKKVLWAKFFLRRNHTDEDFPGQVFLGNNAEDGLRGSIMTMSAVSTMLMVKAGLFCDPSDTAYRLSWPIRSYGLTGINPVAYSPAEGLRYLPHEVRPVLIYMNDMPVRHYDFAVQDATSALWDQASWLWATTEFFDYANPRHQDNWNRVFGYQTPYDGSVMEQKYALLARGLANTVLSNIEEMHEVHGVLVSSWTPEEHAGDRVSVSDLALALVALANFVEKMDLEPEGQRRARELVVGQADFLVRVAASDASYHESYSVPSGAESGRRNMTSQAFAIRGLLAAYDVTDDPRYLEAAKRTGVVWNEAFWDEQAWLYRNDPDDTRVVYTPVDVAAGLGALRELVLATNDPTLLERFKRFFVQAVDASGIMQSEDRFTGEDLARVRAGNLDSDNDGIPFMSGGDGRNGIDSVFASSVEFDLGAGGLRSGVRAPAPLPAPTTGAEVYRLNCEVCHGPGGVGNEGPSLINNQFVQLTGRPGVMQTVASGRVGVGMPAWENVLSETEISLVVDFIRSLKATERQAALGAPTGIDHEKK